MARPTSFRLPLDRLDEEARIEGASTTSLVTTLLDEGLKTRRFPGIVYREGPAGRQAGLLGGPDVWEVARDLKHAPGKGEARIQHVADEVGLPIDRVRLAAEFYAAHTEEIERLLDADEQDANRVRRLIEDRERLLSQ